MTTQFPEALTFNGQAMPLVSYPLEQWFVLVGREKPFKLTTTACWRRYVGSWEIVDGRLYLTALAASLESDGAATLESLFPGFPDRVFAHWFTGSLKIPRGRPLRTTPNALVLPFEQTLILSLQRGVLVSQHTQENGAASDSQGDEYQVSAMTVFGPSAGKAN